MTMTNSEEIEKKTRTGFCKVKTFKDLIEESSSGCSSEELSCSPSHRTTTDQPILLSTRGFEKQGSEVEMMKERFAKLLLGEDMSGCGNGVSTALAVSNAITNLCATLFGQLWRLEPFPPQKKTMWRREMEWFLSVSDHIVELTPSLQTFPDGTKLEVMSCRARSDLYINLPALRKLDNMLLEVLDSFSDTEFWYVEKGIYSNGTSTFGRALQRQEDKWWLPVPRVPPGGLHDDTRKQLQHKRDCTNQILKAALTINTLILAEMDIPDSYFESLPKNPRACLGDFIYRYISSDQFSPEYLLVCLDLSSEHQAIEIANGVEASIYIWRKRSSTKPADNSNRFRSIVNDLMIDTDKRELLAQRAETLLLCLKQQFPGLPQTTLDVCKIQCNKDVGKSILESYSRVVESLAFNIVSRIDDLFYVDDIKKHSDVSYVGVTPLKNISVSYPAPLSGTPYTTAFTAPNFSPAKMNLRSPFATSSKLQQHAKKVLTLTDYLSIEDKEKGNAEGSHNREKSRSQAEESSFGNSKTAISHCRTTIWKKRPEVDFSDHI